MSEGVSFNDDNARGVICIGIPFPSARDRCIEAKQNYNNEQRRLRNRTDLLPGTDWYSQQAYRAIAQALGRCIRHAADYGTVILMDSRHCDNGGAHVNGVSIAHKNLPKWMRHHVRNVVVSSKANYYQPPKRIITGWEGLDNEMKTFFTDAELHVKEVLRKQQDSLDAARKLVKSQLFSDRRFDPKTGMWGVASTVSIQTNDNKAPVPTVQSPENDSNRSEETTCKIHDSTNQDSEEPEPAPLSPQDLIDTDTVMNKVETPITDVDLLTPENKSTPKA